MDIKELESTLNEKGFKEEKQDTGIRYTISDDHVELICYIEPNIEVEFISVYSWNRNDVKGTYNLSIDELKRTKNTVPVLFKKTKNNMPEYIGETTNVHKEVDVAIEKLL